MPTHWRANQALGSAAVKPLGLRRRRTQRRADTHLFTPSCAGPCQLQPSDVLVNLIVASTPRAWSLAIVASPLRRLAPSGELRWLELQGDLPARLTLVAARDRA